MRWYGVLAAVLDGLLLAFWGVASKALGVHNPGTFEYSLVLGVAGLGHILLAGAFPGKKVDKVEEKRPGVGMFFLLISFVLISVAQFYLGVKVYEYKEADVAVSSFLRNSSLVFAALLAHFAAKLGGVFVESRLTKRSLLGTFLFTLGVWIFFNAPLSGVSLKGLASFWVLGSVLIGFNRSLTELLMQRFAKGVRREVMNAVLGAGLLLCSCIGALFSRPSVEWSLPLVLLIAAVGLIIPVMQAFRFTALKALNEVLGKKGYTIWAYLGSSTLFGALFFYEPVGINKYLGLAIGMLAVALLEEGTFKAVFVREKKGIGV